MSEPIIINKEDEFFIAIAKHGIHSFVFLGVMQAGQPKLLARVGKTNSVDPSFGCESVMTIKGLFSYTVAKLQSENLTLRGSLSYSAYAISYDHYLQFTQLMAESYRKDKYADQVAISCYLPPENAVKDNTQVTLEYRPIEEKDLNETNDKSKWVIAQSHYLNISNTCRNTAINLVSYVCGVKERLSNAISRTFFRDLPLKSSWQQGVPNEHFYILPLPPSSFNLKEEETIRLRKIYQRMEDLFKKAPYDPKTIAKFDALKNLYDQLAGQPNASIEQVLESIGQWKAKNSSAIKELRGQSFFGKLFTRKSSTEKMVDDLEEKLLASKYEASLYANQREAQQLFAEFPQQATYPA